MEKIKKWESRESSAFQGAEITDDAETLTFGQLYGEKTVHTKMVCWNAAMYVKEKSIRSTMRSSVSPKDTKDADRFAEVEKIETMSPEEKFAFFQKELSKCIRCNACRNVCPACSCRKCVFDSTKFDSAQKRQMWIPLKKRCSTLSVPSM